MPGLAADLVRLKVELIVAGPTLPALAAKNATATVPVVFWGVGDPVEVGLVASLSRPGGNVTGLSFGVGSEVFSKQLQILKEAVPGVQRVAILSNLSNPGNVAAVSDVKAAGRSLGLSLQFLEAACPSNNRSGSGCRSTSRPRSRWD